MVYLDVEEAREAHMRAIDAFEEAWKELSAAEYEHDRIVGAQTARMRDEKVQATLIPKLVKGESDVLQAARSLSIAQGVVKACDMRVQATYKDWKDSTEQFDREWRSSKTC